MQFGVALTCLCFTCRLNTMTSCWILHLHLYDDTDTAEMALEILSEPVSARPFLTISDVDVFSAILGFALHMFYTEQRNKKEKKNCV